MWVVSLDWLKEKINPSLYSVLDDYLRKIHFLERDFFKNKLKDKNVSKKLTELLK
jgi:hypothetical protein